MILLAYLMIALGMMLGGALACALYGVRYRAFMSMAMGLVWPVSLLLVIAGTVKRLKQNTKGERR